MSKSSSPRPAAACRVAWMVGLLLLAAFWLLPAVSAHAARLPVPTQTASVVDQTGTLDAAQIQALRSQVAALEQAAQAVVTVLVVPTTGEDSIEEFATRVFEQWKPGDKDRDDGVLVLVALQDRRMRIEVGQGLEGVLPDVLAGRIIEQQMKPRFRGNDYHGGLEAAISAIAAALRGEVAAGDADSDAGLPIDVVESAAALHDGGVTPFGWGLLAALVWSFGVGVVRGLHRWPWALTAALVAAGPVALAAVMGAPGALGLAMPSALVCWLGFGCTRSKVLRIVLAGFVAAVAGLVALANIVGADRFWWGVLWTMCAAGACLLGAVIVIGMRMAFQRSRFEFGARSVVALGIIGYVAHASQPTGDVVSWIPLALASVLTLLFTFFPSDGRGGGSSGGSGSRSSGSSSSRSSSSGSSSSSRSSSGGSSSGGGASGSW